MPEFLETLKPYLKADADTTKLTEAITAYNEELSKGFDPFAGLEAENAWEFVGKSDILKKAFDKKISEGIEKGVETFKTKNFDKLYQERYDKEHPPEDEKDKALRELKLQQVELKKELENQQELARAEKLRAVVQAQATELLGKDALKIVDMISVKDEADAAEKLKKVVDFVNGLKKSITEEIFKNHSFSPGNGAGAPETNREKLINDYNEAEKRGDVAMMMTLQNKISKLKGIT